MYSRMSKKIIISIDTNGLVNGSITGVKGNQCLDNLELLEEIVGGKIITHEFTKEYYERNENIGEQKNIENLENKYDI